MRAFATALLFIIGSTTTACFGDMSVEPPQADMDLAGTVTSAVNGAPIPNATVTIHTGVFVYSGWGASATTDMQGRYTLKDRGPCETELTSVYLVARASGYREQSSINNGQKLECTGRRQTFNFSLSVATLPPTTTN